MFRRSVCGTWMTAAAWMCSRRPATGTRRRSRASSWPVGISCPRLTTARWSSGARVPALSSAICCGSSRQRMARSSGAYAPLRRISCALAARAPATSPRNSCSSASTRSTTSCASCSRRLRRCHRRRLGVCVLLVCNCYYSHTTRCLFAHFCFCSCCFNEVMLAVRLCVEPVADLTDASLQSWRGYIEWRETRTEYEASTTTHQQLLADNYFHSHRHSFSIMLFTRTTHHIIVSKAMTLSDSRFFHYNSLQVLTRSMSLPQLFFDSSIIVSHVSTEINTFIRVFVFIICA